MGMVGENKLPNISVVNVSFFWTKKYYKFFVRFFKLKITS